MDQYIYVNYAYESRENVLGIIQRLEDAGMNIVHGSASEEKAAGCSFALNIRTEASHSSKTYKKMLNFLLKHEKDMIQIYMDGDSIVSDMSGQLDLVVDLFKYKYERKNAEAVPRAAGTANAAGTAAASEHEDPGHVSDVGNSDDVSEREALYNRGMELLGGGSEDRLEAVQCLIQSANQGYAPAQYRLSICYDEGTGVNRNPSEAAKWREMAAYGGIVKAQSEMGYCYEYGQGVVRNIREAVRWYRIASEQGDIQAKNNLAYCYQKGRGVSKDSDQAIRLYTEAAEGGHASAQYNLGYCYWYGEGVPADKEKAIKLFRESMAGGNAKAEQMMRVLDQYEYLHGSSQAGDTDSQVLQ